jgi:hypothetical protein
MTAQPQILVEQIPVSQIQPSPTNPRKHYDQDALEELAASIKSVGVQVPLLLRMPTGYRKIPFNYEIVGGERRWRAAQIAGLAAVPAIGDGWSAASAPVRAALTKAKDAELEGWLADLIAADSIDPSGPDDDEDRESLWKMGKLVGVDCDAIAKKATAPVAKGKAAPAPAKKKDERKAANGRAGAMVRKLTKKAVRK